MVRMTSAVLRMSAIPAEDVSGLGRKTSAVLKGCQRSQGGRERGLKKDVSGLAEDVSGLKKDVSGLKEDVSGLKEDVSGLKKDVAVLKRMSVFSRRT